MKKIQSDVQLMCLFTFFGRAAGCIRFAVVIACPDVCHGESTFLNRSGGLCHWLCHSINMCIKYAYVHTHTHIYIYTVIFIQCNTCIHICIYIYIYIYIHIGNIRTLCILILTCFIAIHCFVVSVDFLDISYDVFVC